MSHRLARPAITSGHTRRTGLVTSLSTLALALFAGCILSDSGSGDDDDELDPDELLSNGGSSGSSGSGGSSGSSGSSGSGGSGGSSSTNTALQVDLYQGMHTDEPCATSPIPGLPPPQTPEQCLNDCEAALTACYDGEGDGCDEAYYQCEELCSTDSEPPTSSNDCVYANVYFLATCNGANVSNLSPDDVKVEIGNKDVGVEGSVLLTQQNGLQVDLLLDRSYSITEANAAGKVREAANGFLNALPNEARVRVSAFASEATVPQVLGGRGEDYYYSIGSERSSLSTLISSAYTPYASASSAAFTKLFDASVGLVRTAGVEDTSLAALPSVGVIFTDGADTASKSYETAQAARTAMTSSNNSMKIYAIGLGNAIDEDALSTLSEGRSYSAADKSTLVQVFEDVASELGAIYRYRVLVPSAQDQAEGKLTVNHCGETSVIDFVMDDIGNSDSPSPVGSGPNSCRWAYDNECDEPDLCPSGTDSADCD